MLPTPFVMNDGVEDGSVEVVDLFVHLPPLDADSLGIGDELVRQLVDQDHIRIGGIRDGYTVNMGAT